MPVLAGQWARQSVNLPLRIRLFTTHKLTKSRFPSRVLCPSDHPSRETIHHDSPFRTSQGVLKGCRARPCARAAERARACRRAPGSAISAWPPAVAGSSRWRRGCRPGWPAAPVRGARSHADSHLAAKSATAGRSVRRIRAPTEHCARSQKTSTRVQTTAPRGPGTLRAQRHARGRPHHVKSSRSPGRPGPGPARAGCRLHKTKKVRENQVRENHFFPFFLKDGYRN